jgi:hypothetical protein
MKAFLATVLSVIAAGVLLIAYGLLAPHASSATIMYDPQIGMYRPARPMFANERVTLPDSTPAYEYQGVGPSVSGGTTRTSRSVAASQRTSASRIGYRAAGRNWQKTALVIGGSTATAAGIGGLIGGKKGALIGAAIGGGASTLYEVGK